jgi:hypothetical protein
MHDVLSAARGTDNFVAWAAAYAALGDAERARQPADQTLALAEEVLRRRNALKRERMANGWLLDRDALRQLRLDEYLVRGTGRGPGETIPSSPRQNTRTDRWTSDHETW